MKVGFKLINKDFVMKILVRLNYEIATLPVKLWK